MSLKLVNRSPDLSQLRGDGFDIEVRSANLLVKDVPYLTSTKEVKRGILASELDLAGDQTVAPRSHVAYLVGDVPCEENGATIAGVSANTNQPLGKGLSPNHQLSRKPTKTGSYRDYYEKMKTYVSIVSGPAQRVSPTPVTARTNPVVVPADGESVFKFVDTASTKAGIAAANEKLEAGTLGIVGLGGVGAYVLDLVAKTPVPEIHIFDGDLFLNHNAFRAPGAPSIDDLSKRPLKVHYFRDLYSKMRQGVIAHECFIDEATVDLLRGMSFVFVCIDRGSAKRMIVEKLESWDVPFIDVGMGIQVKSDALLGILAITTSTPGKRDHLRDRVALADGVAANEYSRNVQIADLNALAATLAVIRWKRICGYYVDLEHEHFSTFNVATNKLMNEDPHAA